MTTRRVKRSDRRATRKAGSSQSVEGLRASFEKIDEQVRCAIEKGCTDSSLGETIRKSWAKYFHSDLSVPAMKGMVSHYRTIYKSKSVRKTRKQRGGSRPSAVQGGGMAPLSWTLGQGTTTPVYGRFPVEMGASATAVRALDLGRFYESPISRACDSTGGCAAPGQAGGSMFASAGMFHMPASVPRNAIETGVSVSAGAPIMNPNPSPVSASWQPSVFTPVPFDPSPITKITQLASIA